MACLAPWAYGAREAWALRMLGLGVGLVALLYAVKSLSRARSGDDPGRALFETPSLALLGLVGLGAFQLLPLSASSLRILDPSLASLRAQVLPVTPEVIAGDPEPPVARPPATLSQDPDATRQTLASLAALWVLYQGVRGLGRGRGAFGRFGSALGLNAALLAVFSVIQYLAWDGRIYWVRPSPWGSAGPFFNHNHLAAALNVGFGLILGFLLTPTGDGSPSRSRSGRLFSAYALSVIVLGVVVSLSRTGFLTTLAVAAFGVALQRPVVRTTGKAMWLGLAIVPLFLAALGGSVAYSARLLSILSRSAYLPRTRIWSDALLAWRSRPVWGAGLGAFSAAVPRFLRHDEGEVYFHAESEYVEWLVDGGIVAIALLALLAGSTALMARAAWATGSGRSAAVARGSVLALLSLAFHSLGDFALRTAALAIPAVILAAFLAKTAAEGSPRLVRRSGFVRDARAVFGAAAVLALGGCVVVHFDRMARAEALMTEAGVGLYGRYERAASDQTNPIPEPDPATQRRLIERAIEYRPDWAEAYARLGQAGVRAYSRRASESLRASLLDSPALGVASTVEWLHRQVHEQPPDARETPAALAADPDVGPYLIPALRAFLNARRACPSLALPHERIACLDVLLARGDSGPTYLGRAAGLAGAKRPMLSAVADLAEVEGDLPLASACWRRLLVTDPAAWEGVAAAAFAALPPEIVASDVVPDARLALTFAGWLDRRPEARQARDLFVRVGRARLRGDPTVGPAERLAWEARAERLVGDRDSARRGLLKALERDPGNAAWRAELADWMLADGLDGEARRLALVGLALQPDRAEPRSLLDRVEAAIAARVPEQSQDPPIAGASP